jgi:hypothetical protein
VVAFNVDFGAQNQNMFKSINIDMEWIPSIFKDDISSSINQFPRILYFCDGNKCGIYPNFCEKNMNPDKNSSG